MDPTTPLTKRSFYSLKDLNDKVEKFKEYNLTLKSRVKSLDFQISKQDGFYDPLTQVYTRRHFEANYSRIINGMERNGPASFIMVDVDDFKKINDKHGHQMGDKALKHTASILKDLIRGNDIIGRFGGDEYTIVLEGCDNYTGWKIAERMRSSIEGNPLQEDGKTIPLTVSIGMATMYPQEHSGQNYNLSDCPLVGRADAAVYRTKAMGKNMVSNAY